MSNARTRVMARTVQWALIAIVASTTMACGGIGGSGFIGVQLAAISSESTASGELQATDDGGTTYQLSAGAIYVRHIELDLPDGQRCTAIADDLAGATCDASPGGSSDKISIDGPFVVDLVTKTATPSLADVRIPAGTYKRVDVRIDDGDPADGLIQAGAPLDDHSLVAEANFTYAGSPTTLKLSLKFNEDVRFERPAGVSVSGEGAKLLAALDIAKWFSGLDISDCLDRDDLSIVDGTLLIDDNTSGGGNCSMIENAIKESIKRSSQLDRN